MLLPPASPARSGVTRCASVWDNQMGSSSVSFPDLGSPVPQKGWADGSSPSFLIASYFSLQVPPSYCQMLSWWFLQASASLFYLCLSLFFLFCFFPLCFFNTSRKNCTQTLIQMVSYSKAPHLHRRTPQVFPELSDAENYCRNPGGENERPWCYTKDPSVTWEYCSVSPCGDGRPFLSLYLFWDHGKCWLAAHHTMGLMAPLINSVF